MTNSQPPHTTQPSPPSEAEPAPGGAAVLYAPEHKSSHIPGLILFVPMAVLWLLFEIYNDGRMGILGVSALTMHWGLYQNLVLHMFAHGGVLHIGMNSVVMLGLAGPLVEHLGGFWRGWLRFFALFFASGIAGAGLFLLLNPQGTSPMIGASGAISGMLGVVARLSSGPGGIVPLLSDETLGRFWDFAKANILLILVMAIPFFLAGGGGIAWEAHLGGFLVGLLVAPLLLPRELEPA